MSKFVRDLIEYNGLNQFFSTMSCIDDIDSFKQTNVYSEFYVPYTKPDIQQITKIDILAKILKYSLVKTPKGVSVEGTKLTGYKLLVMGEIDLKVIYEAVENLQCMHTFHADIPFCEGIVLPPGFGYLNSVNPEVYIEDIYVRKLDSRCVFGNINLMLVTDTY